MPILNGDRDSQLLATITERLHEFGVHVEAVHAVHEHVVRVVLRRRDSEQAYLLHLHEHATLTRLQPVPNTKGFPSLIGAQRVAPRSRDALRRAGIQYVDAAGNAWLEFGDVLIDVQGRGPVTARERRPSARGGNLFSPARAQVAFALLQWPVLWKRPQRDTAAAAGVSVGQANDALGMLQEAGFGPGGHRSGGELLDLWVAAYPSGLARKLELARYQGAPERFADLLSSAQSHSAEVLVSGEVAAHDVLRPSTLTIYVPELDPLLAASHRWRSDGQPNVTVYRKFWCAPADARTERVPGFADGIAPPLLVYADLATSDDPRVRGVAKEWREQVDRPEQRP